MLFSVVIPTHKRKILLTQLLNSVEKQKLPHDQFEVIIVATENDESLTLPMDQWSFKAKIIPFINDPLNGKSAASKRNFGVSQAKNAWIAFVDDDCITHENWLLKAKEIIEEKDLDLIEGGVHIPQPEKPTLTYKGLRRLSRPGGFQTCNMFYKKSSFEEVGGFDLYFPFYLEDTDLGWTLLEKGKNYAHCEEAQISHPVPPPQPSRLLDNALRMEKLVYFSKKHRQKFKDSSMKFFSKAYLILIYVDIVSLFSLIVDFRLALLGLTLKTLITLLYVLRMFRKCHFTFNEFTLTYYYIFIWIFFILYFSLGLT